MQTFVVGVGEVPGNRRALGLDGGGLLPGRFGSAGADDSGRFPGGKDKQSFWIGGTRNPNYRAYRRGRENEPGGIGTVTIRLPSVGVRSSLPKARTGLKGRKNCCAELASQRFGTRRRSAVESIDVRCTRVLSRGFSCGVG